MRKQIYLTVIFILIGTASFCQTVKELEYELSFHKDEQWGSRKVQAYKLLEIDGLNEKAINYLVEVYGRKSQRDSISALFDTIIKKNPKSPEPYLIRARERNAQFAGLINTQKINYLKEAKKLDSNSTEATYSLGKMYYGLFIKEYNKNREKGNLDHYAKSATSYFSDLVTIDVRYTDIVKLPLIQLAEYLGDSKVSSELKVLNYQSSYFPVSAFARLPENWETNYNINVFSRVNGLSVPGIESAMFSIKWYSRHLKALEEPVLSDSLPTKIYRFTYLRTFHNPIVIRIENNNDTITIHWKVSDGAGGYEPGIIISSNTKKLSIQDWERVENKINAIKYWELPTVKKELQGTDGSQWILEGTALGKYHVVDRWCGDEIYFVCKELIDLTDLELKENDLY